MRKLSGNLISLLKRENFEVLNLEKPNVKLDLFNGPSHSDCSKVKWEDDSDQTMAILKKYKYKHLIIDHYSFDKKWEKNSRKYSWN